MFFNSKNESISNRFVTQSSILLHYFYKFLIFNKNRCYRETAYKDILRSSMKTKKRTYNKPLDKNETRFWFFLEQVKMKTYTRVQYNIPTRIIMYVGIVYDIIGKPSTHRCQRRLEIAPVNMVDEEKKKK